MKDRNIEQINNKIKKGKVKVVTAEEMKQIVKESGLEKAYEIVDVVTCATFGAMCSSGVFLNFGHSDPPIKMTKVWLNDVPAYTGIAAVDAYIGATELSEKEGFNYGGANVIEDLVKGKNIKLKAISHGTDCYPRKELETWININQINQAIMVNPRNSYQKYNAVTNSSDMTIYTYMGKLLPNMGNITYCGSGELSPLNNDPDYETIGLGTRIFLGGDQGYIIGSGTQHSPKSGFGTLMIKGNLKKMKPEYIKAAQINGYGVSLYVGIGVPIPILNIEIARKTSVSDRDIYTNIIDYSFKRRSKPILKKVSYEELKSGYVELNGKKIKTASISSLYMAKKIANILKDWIENGLFYLTMPVERLNNNSEVKNLEIKEYYFEDNFENNNLSKIEILGNSKIRWDNSKCINCGYCTSLCQYDVFKIDKNQKITFNPDNCTKCGNCKDICPLKAIDLGD
jgi:uncharacterized protein (DUF39 family)/ferredoxin